MKLGVVKVMSDVLELNPNADFFAIMEGLRVCIPKSEPKDFRKIKRKCAISIIDILGLEFGDISEVPDDHVGLRYARDLLGAYDHEIVDVDVDRLRDDVASLARQHRVSQFEVYRLLSYYLDVTPQTLKDKAYSNRFTKIQYDVVSAQLKQLESVEDLKFILRKYRDEKESFMSERELRRQQRNSMTT